MIDRARLSAPRSDLSVLIEPSAGRLAPLARARAGDGVDVTILDYSLSELRAGLRRRLGITSAGPIFVTGHQAEFYHAGVLAKTIAADELARGSGGAAVYVTVDYDTPKTARLLVPQKTASGARRVEVAIPGCDIRRPVIFQPQESRGHWLDFFARVAQTVDDYSNTLLRTFVDAWCGEGAPDEPLDFAVAMSRGRRACEVQLGVATVHEIGGAELCETPEFRAFAAHITLRAEEFADRYNAAQNAYRARHGVRNRSVPAPHLATRDGRSETPFWLLRKGDGRRRLFVARHARGSAQRIVLFADDQQVADLAVDDFRRHEFHEKPWSLSTDGWLLRPRALTLSGFLRMFLADLFLHGIGGAKYDEMTEEFSRSFFGAPLAPMACVTATALADLPRAGVGPADIAAARRRTRDARYNPQRYVQRPPVELLARRAQLIAENAALRESAPHDRSARRRVYDALRHANSDILATDPWRLSQLAEEEAALVARAAQDRISADREYFFALLPAATMHALQQRIRAEFQK